MNQRAPEKRAITVARDITDVLMTSYIYPKLPDQNDKLHLSRDMTKMGLSEKLPLYMNQRIKKNQGNEPLQQSEIYWIL